MSAPWTVRSYLPSLNATPWLTSTAVDVTALGSITLVVLFSAFTLVVLLVLRDRMGAIQLLAASAEQAC